MDAIKQKLENIVSQLQKANIKPLLPIISAIISAKIDENFAQKGRWDGKGTSFFSGGNSTWVERSSKTLNTYKKSKRGIRPPLFRSGVLKRQIEVNPFGNKSIQINVNTPYAAIHQFGGIINHPGGTPYIFVDLGKAVFIKKTTAEKLKQKGTKVYYTKPFTIKIPPRPYITLSPSDVEEIIQLIYDKVLNNITI